MITKEQVMNASGSELDELVALAQGWEKQSRRYARRYAPETWNARDGYVMDVSDYHPSTNGSQCMEIMEREQMGVFFADNKHGDWLASMIFMSQEKGTVITKAVGDTAMIAICRCFVVSKLEVLNGN